MSKTGSPDGPNGPDDLDAAFSEIVAGLRAEGVGTEPESTKRTRDKHGEDNRTDQREPHEDDADGPTEEGSAAVADQDSDRGSDRDADRDADRSKDEQPHSEPETGNGVDVDTGRREGTAVTDWRANETDWDSTMLDDSGDQLDEDEHFVPPEPPPVQKPRQGTVVAWLFMAAGLIMLIAPGVMAMSPAVSLPFGILSLAAGLGLLLIRIKDGPPPGADPHDGSQV